MLAMLIGAVGRTALGNEQLLVHWATRDEDFGVGEEELSAELHAVGAEGWQQVLAELRPAAKAPPSGPWTSVFRASACPERPRE